MHVFESFEHYASALGHANLRMIALGRERASWQMFRTEVDGIPVRMARDGGPCLVDACIDTDGVALMLCIDAAGKVCGNGTPFGPRSVMVLPGRTAVQSTSLDTVSWYSIFIPAARLYPEQEEGIRPPTPCRVIDVAAAAYARLRDLCHRVIEAAMTGIFVDNPAGQRDAAEQLIEAVRAIVDHTRNEEAHVMGRPRLARAGIIDRACGVMESQAGIKVQVRDLASAAGVSVRTLGNAFREQMGLSPQHFVRIYTLNAARRALRQAEPGSTRISEVAARLGIWEWGRFSRDYRRLFGELPSETLRHR